MERQKRTGKQFPACGMRAEGWINAMKLIVCVLVSTTVFMADAIGRTVEFTARVRPPGAYSSSDKPKGGNVAHFYAECLFVVCRDGIGVNWLVRKSPHRPRWETFRQKFLAAEGKLRRDKELLVFEDKEGVATAVAKKTGHWFGPYWEPLPGVELKIVKDEQSAFMPRVILGMP